LIEENVGCCCAILSIALVGVVLIAGLRIYYGSRYTGETIFALIVTFLLAAYFVAKDQSKEK
jgi:hypothetical protein